MSLLSRATDRLWADAESGYRREILMSLPRGSSVRLLDVGCQDGSWTDVLAARAGIPPARVSAIELVPELADAASLRGFDVRIADIDRTWPFDDESFDIVHANQVIEHIRDLDHFACELRRVLDVGGRAIVCTENLASWHNIAALVLGWQPFSLTNISNRRRLGNPLASKADYLAAGDSFMHVHVMTLAALRDLFVSHGFFIERSWGAGYHPLPNVIAARLARVDVRHAHFIGLSVRRAP